MVARAHQPEFSRSLSRRNEPRRPARHGPAVSLLLSTRRRRVQSHTRTGGGGLARPLSSVASCRSASGTPRSRRVRLFGVCFARLFYPAPIRRDARRSRRAFRFMCSREAERAAAVRRFAEWFSNERSSERPA